jgi:hypothetical protein
MNSWIKLTIGCVLMGVGFVFAVDAETDFRKHFASQPCEDCEDEVAPLEENIPSFVDEETE